MKRILFILLVVSGFAKGQSILPRQTGSNGVSDNNLQILGIFNLPQSTTVPSSSLKRGGTMWYDATLIRPRVYDGTGALSLALLTDLTAYAPTTRTLTINGTAFDLSANRSWTITSPVTSVFGRTGVVVAAANDYTFAQLGSKPTTLAGYGITDATGIRVSSTLSVNTALVASRDYSFNGTTATWTLPAISAGNAGGTYQITIKNRGSGNLTINSNAGGNDIYTTSAVATETIAPGAAVTYIQDLVYWNHE